MRLVLVVPVLAFALVAYRLSLTVAAIRADRAGDHERAEHLRTRAFQARLAWIAVAALAAMVLVVVAAIVGSR